MDTILEVIDRISFLAALPAVVGIVVALAFLLIAQRWQLHALAMAILYFFAALLHTRVIRPEVVVVKLLIGWMIALTLYMTGRYLSARQLEREQDAIEEDASEEESTTRFSIPAGVPLRSLVLVAVVLVSLVGLSRFPLPLVPDVVGMACYFMGVGGIFLMGLSEDPFRTGLGLLTFLAGFDLFFGALEPSLAVTGLLGAISFVVALAVTFLAVTHAARWESS